MSERFLRNELYFGKEKTDKLKEIKVCVVGLGGVGAYAVEALARLGVANFVVIDKDVVDITNLNRQIIALESTLGRDKSEVVKERILDINPNAKVETYSMFYNSETRDIILNENVDFVIDAIDTITCKWDLIKLCLDNNIKFISSMGMGNREDLTKIDITTLDKTSYDPLARVIRKKVKDLKINKKIYVVSSCEKPILCDVLGTFMMVPATAGILCANYIINDIM